MTGSVTGSAGQWIAQLLGINAGASLSKAFTYNSGVQGQVPAGQAQIGDSTYLEAYDMFQYQYGKVDAWGSSGYVGTQPYQIKLPADIPGGFQVHTPLVNTGAGPLPPLN